MTILGPEFLVRQIPTISLLLGAVALVVFSDFMNSRIIFPISDVLKAKTQKGIAARVKQSWGKTLAKYVSEGIATSIFLGYCFFGAYILANYIFQPILSNLRSIILIVVIILFLLISWVINTKSVRDKFMQF